MKMGLKSSHWSCSKAWFKGYTFCFTTFLDHLLEHSEAMNEPQKTFKWAWKIKVSSTSSKFCLRASLKTCDLQFLWNAWKCLRVPKDIFFLKISNFVQSFVECKLQSKPGWRYLRVASIHSESTSRVRRVRTVLCKVGRADHARRLSQAVAKLFRSTSTSRRCPTYCESSRRFLSHSKRIFRVLTNDFGDRRPCFKFRSRPHLADILHCDCPVKTLTNIRQ
jgi:hypothetical protein